MPGSPLKRLRRAGIAVPNQGDKPPVHPRPVVRARGSLPSDIELGNIGRAVLLEIAADVGGESRDRVAAARALLGVGQAAIVKAVDTVRAAQDVDTLSDEELEKLAARAPEQVSQ